MDTRLPSSDRWRPSVGRLFRHLAFALLLQLAVLAHLETVLWVGPVIPWDDIAFVERSLLNLDWIRGWRSELLLHAPLGDVQTLLGMGATGFDFRGPYLLNFPHVAALTLFISYYLRSFSGPFRAAVTVVVLVFAPTFMLTTQLKSDYKGGLYFSMATLLLFEPGVLGLVSWRRVVTIAACLLLALYAKMTAIYVPAIAVGTLGLHYFRSIGLRLPEGAGSRARYAGLAALVFCGYGAVLAIQWDHLVAYVRWALSDKWSDPRHPGLGHYLFYTPFGETGRYWFVQAAVAAALFVRVLLRGNAHDRRDVLCVALVALTFWAPLLRNSNYNVDFGSYFYYAVVAVLLVGLRSSPGQRSNGASPNGAPLWALAGVSLSAVLAFKSPLLERREWGRLEGGDAALTQVSEAIHAERSGLRVTFLFDSLVLPHPNLSVIHRLTHGRLLAMNRVDQFEEVVPALGETDFVVALDAESFPALVDLPQWTANVRRAEVVELLDAEPRARLVGTYPVHGGALRLYRIGRGN